MDMGERKCLDGFIYNAMGKKMMTIIIMYSRMIEKGCGGFCMAENDDFRRHLWVIMEMKKCVNMMTNIEMMRKVTMTDK
jgi:hypothetical protein